MAMLDYMKAYRLAKRYGIRTVESRYVGSADQAVAFSNGGRIVLKAMSQRALHKTKSGIVALGLGSEQEIRSAYETVAKRAQKFRPYRMLVQRMANAGIEIIIGGSVDQQFGKMLLVGLGGIYVETFRDFAMRVCPITRRDAASMLHQLRSFDVIAPDSKTENEITGLLMKASDMFTASKMKELDINPVILHDGTYDAVDLRFMV